MQSIGGNWSRNRSGVALALAAAMLLAAGMASAQVPRPAAPGGSAPCSPSSPPLPGSPGTPPLGAGSGQSNSQPGENLSDRLARADGVICPPANVDPEIKAPTPDVGNMPIIPPPGSPGGDPNIRPK
jgi:hypothetical protein